MLKQSLSRIELTIGIILLLCLCVSVPVRSGDRRVEEDKLKAFQATEITADPSKGKIPFSKPPPMDPLDRMYFVEIMMKKITYLYDLSKIISLLLEKENKYITLDAQIMLLRENHLLPRHLKKDFNPQAPLRKGVAAYVFCKALEINGGLGIRMFGLTEHSAINELVYEGILPAGNAKEILTGEELISIFTQAANHRKSHAK